MTESAPDPGLTAVEMFRALEKGRLKAIWIAATNPLVSIPDLHQVRRALRKAQLVVVQDAYHPTETTQLAHVLLPAAQWGEKEWTSTNSERMVSFSPKLFDPPGVALPDYAESRLVVVWGCNPAVSGIHLVPYIRKAQQAGAKLVVIDPRVTPLARAMGPVALRLIASSRLKTPIPLVRSTKIRLRSNSRSMSSSTLGNPARNSRIIWIAFGDASFESPPTRV